MSVSEIDKCFNNHIKVLSFLSAVFYISKNFHCLKVDGVLIFLAARINLYSWHGRHVSPGSKHILFVYLNCSCISCFYSRGLLLTLITLVK